MSERLYNGNNYPAFRNMNELGVTSVEFIYIYNIFFSRRFSPSPLERKRSFISILFERFSPQTVFPSPVSICLTTGSQLFSGFFVFPWRRKLCGLTAKVARFIIFLTPEDYAMVIIISSTQHYRCLFEKGDAIVQSRSWGGKFVPFPSFIYEIYFCCFKRREQSCIRVFTFDDCWSFRKDN